MITLDLSSYWLVVASVCTVLAGAWGLRRVRSLLGR